jgi:tripartite-type tricarboxylate transporter receptor subunit TctC
MKAFIGTLALGLSLMASTLSALAQGYPNKQVRIVVPTAAGTGLDTLTRHMANTLQTRWSQPVIVVNQAGAGTMIGAESVARSAPDGYTLLLTADSTMSVAPHLFKKMPFDPLKDFIPITELVEFHIVMVAHPSVQAQGLADVIRLAKERPNDFRYGSFGVGTAPHLAAEMLKSEAGFDIRHVPYKSAQEALAACMRGEVEYTFLGVLSAKPQMEAGRLKAIAIGGDKRTSLLPDVPTFKELGYAGVDTRSSFGIYAPANTPRPVVSTIRDGFLAVLNDAEFQTTRVAPFAYTIIGNTPEEFMDVIRKDIVARGKAAKLAGIEPE